MNEQEQIGESELQAWADGRLPAGRRAEVDAWLAARPDEADRVAAYRELNDQLRGYFGAVLDEPVPERLEAFGQAGARWRRAAAGVAWLVVGAAVGGVAGWEMHAWRASAPAADVPAVPVLARRAALAHATYAPEVRHPVEVGAARGSPNRSTSAPSSMPATSTGVHEPGTPVVYIGAQALVPR
jgi:anti-sigma factor RsiW